MRIGGAALFVLVLASCGPLGSASGSRVVTSSDVGAPEGGNGNGGEQTVSAAEDTTQAATSPSAPEIVVSGRGFAPQPVVRSGTAGGPVDGGTLSPECVGLYPPRPQHLVKLNGPIDLLRILAATPSDDLTLAVRTPDGVFHCDDDSGDPANGLNPTVELYAPPPGTIEVFVGVYSSSYGSPPYQLGVTEQSGYASDIVSR